MSNHNTPYSSGVIKGVLADMVSCTKELILDGKNVKLDELAHLLRRNRQQERGAIRCRLLAGQQREGAEAPRPCHRRTE